MLKSVKSMIYHKLKDRLRGTNHLTSKSTIGEISRGIKAEINFRIFFTLIENTRHEILTIDKLNEETRK